MSFSSLPAFLTRVFTALAHWLDRRSAWRVPLLLCGLLFARGRRTVTTWFRAAGLADDYRQSYVTVCTIGRHVEHLALTVQATVRPLLNPQRLLLGIDDTPTPRYGPCVEGADIHHHPSPGPAGEQRLYGHVWVVVAALAHHPAWDTIALPLQAQLYLRARSVAALPPERSRPFRTKLELAVAQLQWLKPWIEDHFAECWVAVDGGYAKKPFLGPAQKDGWVVVARLRKDAHLNDVPPTERQPGQRGPLPTYGKKRISLAKRAGQKGGWQQVECNQYGRQVTKTIKTFLATWRPAGGVIRVVLVQEERGWVAFFCTKPSATAVEILEAMADRGALEQTNKDVKEVWGAGQQQVRNLDSNVGCFNLNLWMCSLLEAWAWDKPEAELVDRRASPWDQQGRRPSQQDKRKALQREVLQGEIHEALAGRPTKEKMYELAQKLLDLAL